MFAHIKNPPTQTAPFSRRVWIYFGIFFAATLGLELYRWFKGSGESSQITIMAGMLFMVVFQLARHPAIRLMFFFAYMGLFLVALILMTLQFLHFIHVT